MLWRDKSLIPGASEESEIKEREREREKNHHNFPSSKVFSLVNNNKNNSTNFFVASIGAKNQPPFKDGRISG